MTPDDDYTNVQVPGDARRASVLILAVWLGFIIVAGIMAVGGAMTTQLDPPHLVGAVLAGNAVLAGFAALAGYVGASSGLTFNSLAANVFTGPSARLVSAYVPIVLIGWFGIEAAIFGGVVGEAIGLGTVGRRLLMVAATLAFAFSSYVGFSAMGRVSTFMVPVVVALGGLALIQVDVARSTAHPTNSGSLFNGVGTVMGTWIMGCLTCVPDLTRFAKTPLVGATVAAVGIFFGNSLTILMGAAGAWLTGEHDPAKILISLGMLPLAILLALANIWTTNDNNMYSAALNVSRMLSVSRKRAVLLCAGFAAVLAAFDPTSIRFLFGFLEFMGSTSPALGGIVLGAYLMNLTGEGKRTSLCGWIAWSAGAAAAVLVGGPVGIILSFFVGWGGFYAAHRFLEESQAMTGSHR